MEKDNNLPLSILQLSAVPGYKDRPLHQSDVRKQVRFINRQLICENKRLINIPYCSNKTE